MKVPKIKMLLLLTIILSAISTTSFAQVADTSLNNAGIGRAPLGTGGNNQGSGGADNGGETTRNTIGSARQVNNAGAPSKYNNGDYGPTGNTTGAAGSSGPSGPAGSLPVNGAQNGPNGTRNGGQGLPISAPTGNKKQ